jgi:predicted protein tyrosine phosphatase
LAKLKNGKKIYMNILFVCEGNINRSPFFEEWFKKNKPQYNVKSTGTSYAYYNLLTEDLLKWADRIYLMDIEQEMFFKRKFPDYLSKMKIIGVSDGTPDMERIIKYWVRREGL